MEEKEKEDQESWHEDEEIVRGLARLCLLASAALNIGL